eukprot:CAMPEP_0196657918 /NCGR_PEP_ID=MMETSP1086-20130531/26401_1 /TAXON_ID=77921 /ORGANISM="Cyanoptyche  gloeocystis , Strain SAG4.97" /LENGTH=144 /DNA_ID=CAMNT_0041991241 /DNA_START=65 /DNA_END=499 /DNA_ORIENTATION=+
MADCPCETPKVSTECIPLPIDPCPDVDEVPDFHVPLDGELAAMPLSVCALPKYFTEVEDLTCDDDSTSDAIECINGKFVKWDQPCTPHPIFVTDLTLDTLARIESDVFVCDEYDLFREDSANFTDGSVTAQTSYEEADFQLSLL